MNSAPTIAAIVFMGIFAVGVCQAQGWRGLIPLHSKVADVERQIGPPITPHGEIYDLKTERVNIAYATGGCNATGSSEWNVPKDTVFAITIYPQINVTIGDLRIDLNRFEKVVNVNDPDYISYNDIENGISIGMRTDGPVTVIEYYPRASDKYLRCANYNPLARGRNVEPFDRYSRLSAGDERERLKNFADHIKLDPQMLGYIIVYAGQTERLVVAKARALRAKSYLIRSCNVETDRIMIVNGVRRKLRTVELYLLRRNTAPPNATPNQR